MVKVRQMIRRQSQSQKTTKPKQNPQRNKNKKQWTRIANLRIKIKKHRMIKLEVGKQIKFRVRVLLREVVKKRSRQRLKIL